MNHNTKKTNMNDNHNKDNIDDILQLHEKSNNEIINNLLIMYKYKNVLNSLIHKEFKNLIINNVNNYNLLYFNDKLYNVYLTMCSIKHNMNKEIILQIIYNNDSNNLTLFYKRGRIENYDFYKEIKINDKTINNSGITYFNIFDIYACIEKFKKIFLENTGYTWDEYDYNKNYDKKINKYAIIKTKNINDAFNNDENAIKKHKLTDDDTQMFIDNIIKYNKNNFKTDSYKLKLDNLSEDKLCESLNILKQIQQEYNNGYTELSDQIIKLTETFALHIPIICKHNQFKSIPFNYIDIFIKEIIDAAPYITEHHLNEQNISCNFNTLLTKINKNESFYKMIETYIMTNKGPTHNNDISIINIFKYNKINENFIDYGNNQYLFHGSRFSNIYNILNHGLKIAPKNIPRNGTMFGNGLYFANCTTKSFDYCLHDVFNNNCCLLLCKVSVGKPLYTKDSCYYSLTQLNNMSYNSIYCTGYYTPNKEQHYNINNTIVPIGNLKKNENVPERELMLNYDEYVCYDINQVQIEYIIYCKSNNYNK